MTVHSTDTPSLAQLVRAWSLVAYEHLFGNVMALNRYMRMMHMGAELRKVRGARALDLGCGDGEMTSLLIGRDNAVYGIDTSILGVSDAYPDVQFQQADARYLPFRSECFDFILCSDVFEHMVDFEAVIPEIARVLKREGRAVVSTVCGRWNSPVKVRRYLLRTLPPRAQEVILGRFCRTDEDLHRSFLGHVRDDITAEALERLFADVKMRTVDRRTYCHAAGALLMELFFSFNESARYVVFPLLRFLLPLDRFVKAGNFWQFCLLLEKA